MNSVETATTALRDALTLFGQASYEYERWSQRRQETGAAVTKAEAALAAARAEPPPVPTPEAV